MWLFLAAFLAVLVLGFTRNSNCLLEGIDGTSWRITLRMQEMDRTPFTQTGVDPYQGNFDAYYPVFREYLLPSALAMLAGDGVPGKTLTYTIYATFLLLAAFALARCVGCDRPTALLAGFLLPLMSLPYFPHDAGLFYPLFSLNPYISQIAALSLVIVACFWALEGGSGNWRLWLIPVPSLCLVIALLGLVPYVSLMVPATAWYGGASFLATKRWRDAWPKLLAGALMVAVPAALGMLTYVQGLVGYTAYHYFSSEFQQTRGDLIFASTMFWYNRAGRVWIPLGILGAAWCCFARRGRIRVLAGAHLIGTALYVVIALYIVLRAESYQGPSPVYFETCFWAYSLLFGAVLIVDGGHIAVAAVRTWRGADIPFLSRLDTYLAVILALAVVIVADVRAKVRSFDGCSMAGFAPVRDTAITRALRQDIALHAGMPFRGLTATIDGVAGRPGIDWADLHSYDWQVWRATGNEHRVVGPWWFGIPTLFQYFSFITPPYYLLLTDFLARPTDQQVRSVLVLTRIDPDMLQLWGVRYLITDMPTGAGRQVASVAIPDHPDLRLIALPHPNLGDYSPTTVRPAPDFRAGLRAMHAPDFDPTRSVITDAALPGPFAPAADVALVYEKDGFHLTAHSDGRSLLVLPAQYSHCWSATGTGAPTLFRADLMQLGIAFQGQLDAHLVFRFGPIYAGSCRVADIADMERLNIRAARDTPRHGAP